MFCYRKLYADLVTDSGIVCVAYVAELELFGVRSVSAGYECYTPDGQRKVVRANGAAALEMAPDVISIRFPTIAGSFSYRLERTRAAFDEHRASARLAWQVLAASSVATARGICGVGEISGIGYSDRVELNAPPRALGLSELAWGRGHTENECFVFTELRFRDGSVFRHSLIDGASSDDFELLRPSDTQLTLALPHGAFTLETLRSLHSGSALDEARFPNRFERGLSRALSGRVQEMRALARVNTATGTQGLALHERVHFGAR